MWESIKRVMKQRKGVWVITTFIMACLASAAMTVSYFQGKTTTEQYYSLLEKPWGAFALAVVAYMAAQSYEDGQGKKPPQVVTTSTGDNAKVVVESNRPPPLPPT